MASRIPGSNKMRRAVSLKKKRLQEDGFDLDLAYITDQIIAFGFPAEGREALFRNPMEQCQKFFNTKHPDSYWVYNLCIEKDRQYPASKFHDRVSKFQWADHNAPKMEMIPLFCEEAAAWLRKSDKNVIAVHCKAGKGRTGVLICCLMLHMGKFSDADECMDFYGNARTHNGKGVTIPSQRRFIRQYATVLQEGGKVREPFAAFITSIRIEGLDSTYLEKDVEFDYGVECNDIDVIPYPKKEKKSKKAETSPYEKVENQYIQLACPRTPIVGNTKIKLFWTHPKKSQDKHHAFGWFWVHTGYLEQELVLRKKDIDIVVGDKLDKLYPPSITITVRFEILGKSGDFVADTASSSSSSSSSSSYSS